MNKEQLFEEIDEIYSEWHGGVLHIGKEREDRIKKILSKAINFTDSYEIVKEKNTHTFEVDLNSKKAQKYRCEQAEKILNTPCKVYLFDGENYIELKP